MLLPGKDIANSVNRLHSKVMILETIPEIQKLSPREKLILASELTEEYQATPDDPEMRQAILDLVSERMDHFRENPDSAATLEEFRQKVRRLKEE